MRRSVGLWILAVILCLGARAYAQGDARDQAKRHFAAGEEAFRKGDYRTAIDQFKSADGLVPSPILSFNIGLCHEKLGEDEAAIERYKDYLGRRADAPNRAVVEAKIARLEAAVAAKTPPVRTPDLDADAAVPAPGAAAGGIDVAPGMGGLTEPGAVIPAPSADGSTPAPAPAPSASSDEQLAARLPVRAPSALGLDPAPPAAGAAVSVGPAEQAPGPPPEPAPAPAPERPKGDSSPVYKQWWFWVVVGVSAVILIDIARSDDNRNGAVPSETTGATLFRF